MTEQLTPTPATQRAVAVRVTDLTKIYGSGQAEVRALDGVTLDLYTGQFTAVMGPSGSGQVDADALLRRARRRDQRLGACSATSTSPSSRTRS